jgi:hypothetical protein
MRKITRIVGVVLFVIMLVGCSKEPPHKPTTKIDEITMKIKMAPSGSLLLDESNKVVGVVHHDDKNKVMIQSYHPEAVVTMIEPLATASIYHVVKIVKPDTMCHDKHIAKVGYEALNLSKFDNVHVPEDCIHSARL